VSRREAARRPAPREVELPPEHRRRWLIRTVVTVTVVLGAIAAGPWVYATFFAPEPAEPLVLTGPTPARSGSPEPEVPATVPVGELEGTWTVSEGSEAGYRLREVLSGAPVTVVGRTDAVSGELVVADGSITGGQVTVDVAAIATDETARDAYFRRAMDTTTYPEASFVLEQPVDLGPVAGTTAPVAVEAVGTLTMRGLARQVTAQLEVQRGVDGVEVVGSIPVTLQDYGLTAPDLGFVTVEPTGTVELRLLLVR
jgi:polyisoprenoid-binding protein YceI